MSVFTLIQLGLVILLPVLTGHVVLRRILGQERWPMILSLAVSYGLGMGLWSEGMLLLRVLHIPWTMGTMAALIFLALGFLMIFPRVKNDAPKGVGLQPDALAHPDSRLTSYLSIVLWAGVLYAIFYMFWFAVHVPIEAWDAMATSSFKAKVFFYEQEFTPLDVLPYPSYPLLTPLLETWIALGVGNWSDQSLRILYPLMSTSYLILHYFFLRALTNRWWAILGVLLVVSSRAFVSYSLIPYREIFIIYYNCGAIMLLVWWARHPRSSYLWLAGLFSGLMTFTKEEGVVYLFIHLMLLGTMLGMQKGVVRREKIDRFLKFLIPAFFICLFFQVVKIMTHAPFSSISLEIQRLSWSEIWSRALDMGKIFPFVLFLSNNWNILWILFLLSLLRFFRSSYQRELVFLIFPLATFFILYTFIGLFTSKFYWIAGEEFFDVTPRAFLQFFPLAALAIVLLNQPSAENP